jgi:hypothetical protein
MAHPSYIHIYKYTYIRDYAQNTCVTRFVVEIPVINSSHFKRYRNTVTCIDLKFLIYVNWGHAVAQLVEVLCYKPEGCGFKS